MAGKAKGKKPAVAKPFLKGAPTDETSVRRMAGFFGIMLLTGFMTFIVCSMTSFQSVFLRILVNAAIVVLILLIYASKGTEHGTEGV